ncbi:MAG: zinc-binding dehydrogenase, partial [Patescibacteria group bacterium]
LIHAAGSGVSSAGIQIAKLFRARVIATAGSKEKCEKAKALGASDYLVKSDVEIKTVVEKIKAELARARHS